MWLTKTKVFLVLAIFGFSWTQASPTGYLRIDQPKCINRITLPPLAYYVADSYNDRDIYWMPVTDRREIPQLAYVPVSNVPDSFYKYPWTLEDNARNMPLYMNAMQIALDKFIKDSDELKKLLDMLIIKDEPTSFQRRSKIADKKFQTKMIDLLAAVRTHLINIAQVQRHLDCYKTIHEWDSLLKDDKVVDKLIYFFNGMTFVSRTNRALFQELDRSWAI